MDASLQSLRRCTAPSSLHLTCDADLIVLEQHGRDPAQILLRWSLQKGYVQPAIYLPNILPTERFIYRRFVPLVKSATPSRIVSNTKIYDFELDEEDMKSLDAMDQGPSGAISWNPVATA